MGLKYISFDILGRNYTLIYLLDYSAVWSNSAIWFLINSAVWSKIRPSGFLFIQPSGFSRKDKFALGGLLRLTKLFSKLSYKF